MNHCTRMLAAVGVVLALSACNKSPTTPQPEPTTSPPAPATTTPEQPSPSNTPSSSMPPPTAPSDSSSPSQPSPSALPPPATPSGQGGPNSMLKSDREVATHFNPAWLRHAVLDVEPGTLPRATDNGAKGGAKGVQEKKGAKPAATGNDRNFIQRVGSDGQSEEQAALYVASKTFNDDVRTFAAQMGRDHGKANQQLRQIALTYGIEVPPDPEGLLREKLDRLRQMAGPQMDRAFLQDFAVQGQQDAIALFELQARQGQGQELKEFAAKRLPTLRESYTEAKGLQQKYAPKAAVLSI